MRLGPLPDVINSRSAARLTLKSFPSKWSAQPSRLKLDGRARHLLPLTDTLFFFFSQQISSPRLFSTLFLSISCSQVSSLHCKTHRLFLLFTSTSHFLLILDALTLHRFLVSTLSFNVWTPLVTPAESQESVLMDIQPRCGRACCDASAFTAHWCTNRVRKYSFYQQCVCVCVSMDAA